MSAPRTRNLTILFTDIKGFTEKTSRKSRSDILAMLDKHKELVLPVLEAKGGKLVKTIGDAFLVVFESPTDAVLAGVEVQDRLRGYNADKTDDDRMDVRIAINTGEATIADNDVFGDPVNIAARIEAVAEAGEVFFTEATYLAMNKREVPSAEIGLLQLKGIPERIRAYKVVREHPVEELPPAGPNEQVAGNLEAAPEEKEENKEPLFQIKDKNIKIGAISIGESGISSSCPPSASARERKRPAQCVKAPRWRRALAFGIDIALVTTFASILIPGEKREIRIHQGKKSGYATRNLSSSERSKKPAADIEIGDKIKINDKGVKIKDKIEITEDGVRIGDNVRINDKGVKIGKAIRIGDPDAQTSDSKKENKPENTTIRFGLDGVSVETEDDSETVFENDGWKVSRNARRKSPAWAILWILYGTLFLTMWGATPGKRILKLTVQTFDGGELNVKDAALRSVFSLVSLYVAGLGYLWGIFEKEGRTWHDLLASTVVKKEAEPEPAVPQPSKA